MLNNSGKNTRRKKLRKASAFLRAISCMLLLLIPSSAHAEQEEIEWSSPPVQEPEKSRNDQDKTDAQEKDLDLLIETLGSEETNASIEETMDEEENQHQTDTDEEHSTLEAQPLPLTPPLDQSGTTQRITPPSYEFIGFSPAEDRRSLGKGIYRGTSRSDLTKLLKTLPGDERGSLTIYKTTNRLLLTAGQKSDLIEDAQPVAGEDILTLRLEKLLERGLYEEAAAFYTSLDSEPDHERLAAAGLTALIMTGRKSLACLDIKSFFEDQAVTEKWKELGAYCNLVMTIASGSETGKIQQNENPYTEIPVLSRIAGDHEYRENYSPGLFRNLSPFERSVIIAEGRLNIDLPALKKNLSEGNIPPADIQPLLQNPDLDLDTRLQLISEGLRSSTVSESVLFQLFKTTKTNTQDKSPAAQIIRVYERIKAKEPDNDLLEQMRTALRETKTLGPESMIPLLPTLETVSPETFPPQEYSTALFAFMAAERDLPPTWQKSVARWRDTPKTAESEQLHKTLLLQIYLLTEPGNRTESQKNSVRELLKADGNKGLWPFFDIIENIDKGSAPLNNGLKVYENGFDTPTNKGYTMPSADPRASLEKAVRANAVGETVLLSNWVVRRVSAEPVSPEALIEVTRSYRQLGLYDQVIAITAEAVFAAIK